MGGKEQEEPYKLLQMTLSEENKVSHLQGCTEAAEGLFLPVGLGSKCDFKLFPKTLREGSSDPTCQAAD